MDAKPEYGFKMVELNIIAMLMSKIDHDRILIFSPVYRLKLIDVVG